FIFRGGSMASARSDMALGQIQRLFDEGTLTGLTDAQLVERFLDRRDEGAFAALVARHGPMVLAVCRGVLRDQSDAEDALQAPSYDQAGARRGWPRGTVGSRIARARELLRSRLSRRGVTATTAALSVLLAREATAAPTGWVEAATRAAMRLGEGAGGATAA